VKLVIGKDGSVKLEASPDIDRESIAAEVAADVRAASDAEDDMETVRTLLIQSMLAANGPRDAVIRLIETASLIAVATGTTQGDYTKIVAKVWTHVERVGKETCRKAMMAAAEVAEDVARRTR
jgi:predicted regulator of Ras-like GTPase activity (Roadblock/LC7/MglB family)